MENIILIILLLAIAAGASIYIFRAKKRGQACIGCPHAKNCNRKCADK